MRWFKHFTDNHRGKSQQLLFDEMGHIGIASYYILVEICAEKLNRFSDKTLESSDCLFEFHPRILRQNLRISPTNLRRLLDICQTFGLLSFEFSGNLVKISMPILLDLLEYDQKKFRPDRAKVPPGSRLEQNRIEKNRIEQNILSCVSGKHESDPIDFGPKFKPDCAEIYKSYPLKKGKAGGLKIVQREITSAELQSDLLRAIAKYSADLKASKTEKRYIKHFSTFMGQWRDWLDDDAGKETLGAGKNYQAERDVDHQAETDALWRQA